MEKALLEKLDRCDWWRLNRRVNNKQIITEVLEWTYHCGGYVRAKIDDTTAWSYKRCQNAKHAKSLGNKLIYKQKKGRT